MKRNRYLLFATLSFLLLVFASHAPYGVVDVGAQDLTATTAEKSVRPPRIGLLDIETIDTPSYNGPSDEMTAAERDQIQEEVWRNISALEVEGKLWQAKAGPTRLEWPTRRASGLNDFNIGQISSYVDQNLAFPNQVLDWNCGSRTYDQTDGYNHAGIDINSFAFPWRRMYQNEVEVVAAAPGIIIVRDDGAFDQSCSQSSTGNVNRVILMHPDSTVTWYLHLKNGSVTSKSVGEHVDVGEYLGIAGSSGRSTVPHLHLELHDSSGALQEPFTGPCNSMNNFSWWVQQEPYRNSRINTLLTGSALPQFPACPAQEITNEKIVFQPNDPLITTAHFRDLQTSQEVNFSILMPDSSIFQAWSFTSPNTLNATFRSATWQIPSDAQIGKWIYRVVFNGVTYERPFYVGQPPNVSITGRIARKNGSGFAQARVTLFDSNSTPIASTRTNSFGYYTLHDVVVGATYNIDVTAKGASFNPRNLMVIGQLDALDFTSK